MPLGMNFFVLLQLKVSTVFPNTSTCSRGKAGESQSFGRCNARIAWEYFVWRKKVRTGEVLLQKGAGGVLSASVRNVDRCCGERTFAV